MLNKVYSCYRPVSALEKEAIRMQSHSVCSYMKFVTTHIPLLQQGIEEGTESVAWQLSLKAQV